MKQFSGRLINEIVPPGASEIEADGSECLPHWVRSPCDCSQCDLCLPCPWSASDFYCCCSSGPLSQQGPLNFDSFKSKKRVRQNWTFSGKPPNLMSWIQPKLFKVLMPSISWTRFCYYRLVLLLLLLEQAASDALQARLQHRLDNPILRTQNIKSNFSVRLRMVFGSLTEELMSQALIRRLRFHWAASWFT